MKSNNSSIGIDSPIVLDVSRDAWFQPGEKNGMAVLTEAIVRDIHAMAVVGIPDTVIAEDRCISSTHVRRIRLAEEWTHLGLPRIETQYGVLPREGEGLRLRIWKNYKIVDGHPRYGGGHDKSGYGTITYGTKPSGKPAQPNVVRVLWELERGPLGHGDLLKNKDGLCGLRDCLNLDHWNLGSRSEMVAAAHRAAGHHGDEKHAAKLVRAEALKIVRICAWNSTHAFYPKRASGKPQLYCDDPKCKWSADNAARRSKKPPVPHGDEERFLRWSGEPVGELMDADGHFINCQEFLGKGVTGGGFKAFSYEGGEPVDAHRYALERALGRPLAEGEWAMHACDWRSCVRTDGPRGVYVVCGEELPRFGHLVLGTARLNSLDMHAKHRATQDKLSDDDVRQACEMYSTGMFSQEQVADRFDGHQTTMGRVLRGVAYLHVKRPR